MQLQLGGDGLGGDGLGEMDWVKEAQWTSGRAEVRDMDGLRAAQELVGANLTKRYLQRKAFHYIDSYSFNQQKH